MSEIAKCQCGAAARAFSLYPDGYRVQCDGGQGCGVRGAWRPTEAEAIAAWNALMRPRPVAEWVAAEGPRGDEPHGFAGSLWLGQVALGYVSVHRAHGIVDHAARCHIDGKGEYFRDPDPASARAWLEERVRAAGFEVREESSCG